MAEMPSLSRRPWATAAAISGFAMLALYVTLMVAEGNNSLFEVLPWALLMAAGAVLAFAAAHVADRRLAQNLLLGATVLFGVIGAISLLSIGLGFLLAAALAVVGAARLSRANNSD